MSKKAQGEEMIQELKAQYLGYILGLMKQSTDLMLEGRSWLGLEHLERIMHILVLNQEGKGVCNELIKKVDEARNETYLQVLYRWPSSHTKTARLEILRNKRAREIYNPIMRAIQNELTIQEYYSFLGMAGFSDPSKGRESGRGI